MSVPCSRRTLLTVPAPFPCPLPCPLHRSALPLRAAGGSGVRVFGWQRLGRRIAFDLARALSYIHHQGEGSL